MNDNQGHQDDHGAYESEEGQHSSPEEDAVPAEGVGQDEEMTFRERIYLFEVVRGMAITLAHLIMNILRPGRIKTIEYPEKQRPFPERFRAKHRLNKWDSGHTKCTACMCCATACPAGCITIVAGEYSEPLVKVENGVRKVIEKYPTTYDIDLLKCVYCGFCVDACPCDAIKMDTGKFPHAAYSREEFLWQNRFQDGLPTLEKQAVDK